ncbi:MAG: hypothetical protein MUP92_04710, partial [Actinobacteria bacterium]|nr:hypothetical protein [Actinomycetota bacterium]
MKGKTRYIHRAGAAALVLLVAAALLVSGSAPAEAAIDANIDVQPLGWDVLGLDSNKPFPPSSEGPNTYEVGVRACNTTGG